MKNGIIVLLSSLIISVGIGVHGYFIGEGVKESQPWHHLSDPLGLIRNIEIPESLNLGFKAEKMGRNGITFKLKIEEQAYKGHVSGDEGVEGINGEMSFEEIDLVDY